MEESNQAIATAQSFVATLNDVIIFPLIILLSSIALLVFVWGGFQYVYNSADSKARETGRSHLVWGIVGLLVMVSAYAILEIAAGAVSFNQRNKIDVEKSSEGIISGPRIETNIRPFSTNQTSQ